MPRTLDHLEPAVPTIRLAVDFRGYAVGEIVTVSDVEYLEALDARVVAKTYRRPVPTVGGVTPQTPAITAEDSPTHSPPPPGAGAHPETQE